MIKSLQITFLATFPTVLLCTIITMSLLAYLLFQYEIVLQLIKFVNCEEAQTANFTEYPSLKEKDQLYYINVSHTLRRQPLLLSSSSKLYFQLSSRRRHRNDRMRTGLKQHLNLRLKLIRRLSILLFGAVKTFLTLFNIQNTFISSSASNYQ
jgi:hypothetical protein